MLEPVAQSPTEMSIGPRQVAQVRADAVHRQMSCLKGGSAPQLAAVTLELWSSVARQVYSFQEKLVIVIFM